MDACVHVCIYKEALDVHDRADFQVFIIIISFHFISIILFYFSTQKCVVHAA